MADGKLRKIESIDDIKIGHVVRRASAEGHVSPFEDSIIASVSLEGWAKLVRPYIRMSTLPGGNIKVPQVCSEEYMVTFVSLADSFQLVLTDRGDPMSFVF